MRNREKKARSTRALVRTSWDPLARWYDGWVGKGGSKHHRNLAIPAVLELLEPASGERILDIGAGQGVLAPHIFEAQASYVGVEVSEQMLNLARKHHGTHGKFILGDAQQLQALPGLAQGTFDAVVFLLSIQDMDPLQPALESAAWALKPGGRIVILTTHPCFRIPRQSGWGWDEKRSLQYRRIDRYLTPLAVPMKAYEGGITRSFHRPLKDYINGLADAGLFLDRMNEIPTYKVTTSGPHPKAVNLANEEIPLFVCLRARKVSTV